MQSATDFLSKFHPNSLWVITAIEEGQKDLPTQTFHSENKEECQAFIDKHNGKMNLYFHVNTPICPVSKKMCREDIQDVVYFHVDIDPPKDTKYDPGFCDSILPSLLEDRPKDIPKPTFILFSGGGIQAFWKLKTPIPINGDLPRAEEAKTYNQFLEKAYKADNCHNIDRLMRLPFTENLPKAKKRKLGRVKTTACVLDYDESCVYDASEFKQYKPGPPTKTFQRSDAPTPPSKVPKIDHISDLDEYNVPNRLQIIIVQGHDPDNPLKGDNSRSTWVFKYCCDMIRLKVPVEVIYSILVDPKYGISESILEMGPKASWAAMRQIQRAKVKAISPELLELNDRHFVLLNRGGDCCTAEELYNDALKRDAITYQSFGAFRNRYLNRKIKVGENKQGEAVYESLGAWWLKHPMRREYDTIVFSPEKDIPGAYNLWQGFSVHPTIGDCSLYLKHIEDNICCGNKEHFDYLIKWMATCVQDPAQPGHVAVVLRGEKGTGKGVFASTFGKLFGRHFMQISNPGHLIGNFNAHLRDCLVLFGDEAFFAGDKKHESVLKTLITEAILPIEAKYADLVQCPNYIHLILAANDKHVVPASGAERRYFVMDVSTQKMQDSDYFQKIKKQMENGGLEALLYFLQKVDLDGFNVRNVPQTEALIDQKERSLSTTERWWYDILKRGHILEGDDGWQEEVVKEQVVNSLFRENGMGGGRYNRDTVSTLKAFLDNVAPGLDERQLRREVYNYDEHGNPVGEKVTVRKRFLIMPSLMVCRDTWQAKYPGLNKWEEAKQQVM